MFTINCAQQVVKQFFPSKDAPDYFAHVEKVAIKRLRADKRQRGLQIIFSQAAFFAAFPQGVWSGCIPIINLTQNERRCKHLRLSKPKSGNV
jgi:hypothetical protein